MKYYVYYEHIPTGKQQFVNVYDTAEDAVSKITSLYNLDKRNGQASEYYYFMKRR